MVKRHARRAASSTLQTLFVGLGSAVTTILLFLLLPVINAMAEGARPDVMVFGVEATELPPPPDVVEEEEPEPEEEEPEEEPPELEEELEPLDLAQLEMLMSTDFGAGGAMGAVDFKINLPKVGGGDGADGAFSMSDLDGKPTALDRTMAQLKPRERSATPGKVVVIFIVDPKGRVKNPKVQSSSDPALNPAALRSVKKWRFQPGTRKGKAVSTRVRQSIEFPKQ